MKKKTPLNRFVLISFALFSLFFWACESTKNSRSPLPPKNVQRSGPTATKQLSEVKDNLPDIAVVEKEDPLSEDNPMRDLDNKRIIHPGDHITYVIAEEDVDARVLFVADNGSVYIPLVGSVVAQGKTAYVLSRQLSYVLEKEYYSQATVLISDQIPNRSTGEVFILGQVAKQGPIEVPSDRALTVSRAILAAGGFTVQADATRVSLIRRDPSDPTKEDKINVNVSEILNNGRLDLDVSVYPDDFIFVPSKGDTVGEILVTGAVRSPGPYPIPVGVKYTVSQAIFRAGGFDEFADKDSVKVIRHKPGTSEDEREITVNVEEVLEKGRRDLDIQVYPEDVIIVPERWFNF